MTISELIAVLCAENLEIDRSLRVALLRAVADYYPRGPQDVAREEASRARALASSVILESTAALEEGAPRYEAALREILALALAV